MGTDSSPRPRRFQGTRATSGWLFVVASLVFFSSLSISYATSYPRLTAFLNPVREEPTWFALVLALSGFTSVASLVTFLTTTIIAWRKERRESTAHALEITKKDLEIEKLRRELEDLDS